MARLTLDQERAIVVAYEAWDPRQGPVEALLPGLGVSKTTLFNVLARNGVALKTKGGQVGVTRLNREAAGDVLQLAAEAALDHLFKRLRDAENRVEELEAAIAGHPRCKYQDELRAVLS